MARKSDYEKVLEDLSHKVRNSLGVMVGTSTLAYVTPADVAEHIMDNYKGLSEDERKVITSRVGGLLAQMVKLNRCNIFRTDHKMSPVSVNRKAQYGYRIGPSFAPLRTTEVRLQEKMTAEAVIAAGEDPVEFLQSIMGQMPLLKLNALLASVSSEIQNRVLSYHVHMSDIEKRIQVLSDDFKSLSGNKDEGAETVK